MGWCCLCGETDEEIVTCPNCQSEVCVKCFDLDANECIKCVQEM